MMKNKKGMFVLDDMLIALVWILVSSPWVLLGIGIFIMVLILMSYFMLGKILAAIMIIGAIISYIRTKSWLLPVIMVGIGLVMFFNPFEWSKLSMMW